jgi:tRNA (guanine37-N1)-methyltransferase
MVHCYCFTQELEREAAERDIRHVRAFFWIHKLTACVDRQDQYAWQRVEEHLGHTLSTENEISVHLVRSVAPNKDMYSISFRLPRATAFGEPL